MIAAARPCKLKEEEQNFIKISFLNFKYSPILVRQFFDRNIPPNKLAYTINRNMQCITELIRKRRITAAQEDILRRIPGTVWPPTTSSSNSFSSPGTTSSDFDLTLMICLLRNIGNVRKPTSGWDQLPSAYDKTDGAFLARLKYYRNMFAHSTESSIPSHEFKVIWTIIEEALTHLNGGQIITDVTDLFHQNLDSTAIETELADLKQQYLLCESEKAEAVAELAHYKEGHLPRNIEDNLKKQVKSWIIDDEVFYETRASKEIYNKLRSSHFVTVTGNSGSGKTAATRHVALEFQRMEYQIISVESPDKIVEYNRNRKQLFLVDDVLGKYAVDTDLLRSWERQDEKIRQCLKENGETKILCTLRNQVALDNRFVHSDSILKENIVDIDRQSLLLTDKEKRCIFQKHLSRNSKGAKISEGVIRKICQSPRHAFPLLCRLGTSDAGRLESILAFFYSPFEVLQHELKKLYINNRKVYCSLVLCMLMNGSIPRDLFHNNRYNDIFFKTTDACGLGTHVSKLTMLDSVHTAVGSYLLFNEHCIQFVHDALPESLSLHFLEVNPHALFNLCDFSVIRDRVDICSDFIPINESIISINSNHFEFVARRILAEIEEGRFSDVVRCQVITKTRFVKHLGEMLDTRQMESLVKKNSSLITPKQTLLHLLVSYGCVELFNCFWTGLSRRTQKRFLGKDLLIPYSKPFFPFAVLKGNLYIVKILIFSDADVNCFSKRGETPLTIAIRSSRVEIVRFLIENGAKLNKFEMFNHTSPCAVSFKSDNENIVKLLIENDVALNRFDLYGNSPFTIAISGRKHNILNLLLGRNSTKEHPSNTVINSNLHNINSKYSFDWTALHIAVLENNETSVRRIFDETCSTDAQWNAESDVVRLQIERQVKIINSADIHGYTPLHFAVINDNACIANILLSHGAILTVRDSRGRTPMHYIQSAGMAEILVEHCHVNKYLKMSKTRQPESASHSKFRDVVVNDILGNLLNVPVFKDTINVQDYEGNTPLHAITEIWQQEGRPATYEYVKIVDIFKMNGVSMYLRNILGAFPTNQVKCGVEQIIFRIVLLLLLLPLFVLPSKFIFDQGNTFFSNCTSFYINNSDEIVNELSWSTTKWSFLFGNLLSVVIAIVNHIVLNFQRYKTLRKIGGIHLTLTQVFQVLPWIWNIAIGWYKSFWYYHTAASYVVLVTICTVLTPTRIVFFNSNAQPFQKYIVFLICLVFPLVYGSSFLFATFPTPSTYIILGNFTLDNSTLQLSTDPCSFEQMELRFNDNNSGVVFGSFMLLFLSFFLWCHCADILLNIQTVYSESMYFHITVRVIIVMLCLIVHCMSGLLDFKTKII